MKPLFMWAGGKTKLLDTFSEHLPENFDTYVEPFFGGGAVFTWAYAKNPDAKFVINDINPHIMEIYRAIKGDLQEFCTILDDLEAQYISLLPPTYKKTTVIDGKKKTKWLPLEGGAPDKELEKKYKLKGRTYDWDKIYEIRPSRRTFFFKTRSLYQENLHNWSETKRAAHLYFLMKTGFNGVWQAKKSTGLYNTPCGLMRHKDSIYDKKNVASWNAALQNATILSGDFKETLEHASAGSFVYLDPPYRGGFADYDTVKDDNFQETVISFFESCKNKGSYCLLSNRDLGDNFFESRKGTNKLVYFNVTYTVGRKKKNINGGHDATKATEILMIGS
jgi:DNA adenine methylase